MRLTSKLNVCSVVAKWTVSTEGVTSAHSSQNCWIS